MKKVMILSIWLTFVIPVYASTIYKWEDKEGIINFTDDYNKIPSLYRGRVEVKTIEVETRKEVPKEEPLIPTQGVTPIRQEEEVRTDLYGRDETWWQDKVRPWKAQLAEAMEHYEKAQRNFTKKSEELSQTNFYGRSRSQTKWDVMKLNRIHEEKKKYEAQIAEAKEMLERLVREAQEAKAPPAWLQ